MAVPFTTPSKPLLITLSLILLVIAVGDLASRFLQLNAALSPAAAVVKDPRATPLKPTPAAKGADRRLATLFGKPEPATPAKTGGVATSRSELSLVGVITSSTDSGFQWAILRAPSGTDESFRAGASVATTTRLTQVEPQQATLEQGGRRELLKLPDLAKINTAKSQDGQPRYERDPRLLPGNKGHKPADADAEDAEDDPEMEADADPPDEPPESPEEDAELNQLLSRQDHRPFKLSSSEKTKLKEHDPNE